MIKSYKMSILKKIVGSLHTILPFPSAPEAHYIFGEGDLVLSRRLRQGVFVFLLLRQHQLHLYLGQPQLHSLPERHGRDGTVQTYYEN